MHPGYYYHPQPPPPDPRNEVTATDVLLPIVLSLICGVGGFVWGLVRFAGGRNRAGWLAVAINFGVWVAGVAVWVAVLVVLSLTR